eukprot:scaffold12836_cov139-Skeletonema_dohrnii-CCMP3373.AAC.1
MITEYPQSQRRFRLRWFCSYYRYDGNGHNMKVEIDASHLAIVAVAWWIGWLYRALSVAKNIMNGVSLFDVNITITESLSSSAPGQAIIALASEEGANVEKTRHQYNTKFENHGVDFSHEMLGG